MRFLATLAVLVVLPAPACALADRNHPVDAGTFAARIVRLIAENDYADAWVFLHPLHRRAAPLERYVQCENFTPIRARLGSVRAIRVRRALVRVAGTPEPLNGTKVTLRIVIDGAPIVETVGLVPAAHGWVWLLPAARYAAYLAGGCPQ